MKQLNLAKVLVLFSAFLPFYAMGDNVMQNAADSISDTADQVGDAVVDTGKAVGTTVSDSAITANVKSKFALDSSIPSGISVTTQDGVVYLSGIVTSSEQAEHAIDVARGADGVSNVNSDQLKVESE